MNVNWKIAVPIAVLVVVLGALMVRGRKTEMPVVTNDAATTVTNTEPTGSAVAVGEPSSSVAPASGVSQTEPTTVTPGTVVSPSVTSGTALTAADVDAFSTTVTSGGESDGAVLNDSASDVSTVSSDSQSINDFTTAYDQTTI